MALKAVSQHLPCPQCGTVRRVTYNLQSDAEKALCRSCGRKTHGLCKTRLYYAWHNMRVRCGQFGGTSEKNKRYAELGITVCDEWRNSFVTFAEWAQANGYAADLQIDRVDGSRGYSPENCRWVTPSENSRNRSTSKLTEADVIEIKKRLSAGGNQTRIGREYGVAQSTIRGMITGRVWASVPWPDAGPPETRKRRRRCPTTGVLI